MSQLKLAVGYLQSLDVEAVALLPTVIGILLAGELNSNEQETLGNFLIDIGDVLFTTSSLINIKKEQEEAKSDKQGDNSQSEKDDQEKMQRQIDDLQLQNQEMMKVIQQMQKT